MPATVAAVAIAFWLFLTVVSVAGIIQDYRKKQLALDPLRLAIERGHQLDPEVISRLLGQTDHEGHVDPRYLDIGGVITCSAGVGVVLLSWFLARVIPSPYYLIVLGAGVVVICVGVGLMISARVLNSYAAADQQRTLTQQKTRSHDTDPMA
jgi:hypothetical protein